MSITGQLPLGANPEGRSTESVVRLLLKWRRPTTVIGGVLVGLCLLSGCGGTQAQASDTIKSCAASNQHSLQAEGTLELGAWNAAMLECWELCQILEEPDCGANPRQTSDWNADAVTSGD